MTLLQLKATVNKAEGAKTQLTSQLEAVKTTSRRLATFRETLDKSIVLIQTVAKETQEQLKFHIEDIVQLAMDACFPDKYQFKVEFELKRGRTEARIFLLEQGQEIDPMSSNGGGLVDIVSFALRFAAWSLSKTDKCIILDEPFKWLDRERKPLAMEILKQLSTRLGLQVITVTHDKEMVDIADKVIKVNLVKDGKWNISNVVEAI